MGTQDTNSFVTGSGYFYNTYDNKNAYAGLSLNANSSAQLSAPSTGNYAGILFMQDRELLFQFDADRVACRAALPPDLREQSIFRGPCYSLLGIRISATRVI